MFNAYYSTQHTEVMLGSHVNWY